MLAFAVGFALVHGTLLVWGIVAEWDRVRYDDSVLPWLAAELLLLPIASVLVGLELVHRIRPRRAFDPRVHDKAGALLLRGLAAGVLSAAGIAAALALLDGTVPEPMLVTLVPAAVGAAVVSTMPRCRQGHCVRCGYDLTACMGVPRCPECGAFGSAACGRRRRRGRSGPPPLGDRHAAA